MSEVFDNVKDKLDMTDNYLVFLDPSNSFNPGWPLRLLMAALLDHCPYLVNTNIKVIGLRCDRNGRLEKSILYSIDVMPEVSQVIYSNRLKNNTIQI